MSRLTKLKAAKAQGLDQARALLDTADAEGRDLSDDEQSRYDALMAADDDLNKKITAEDDLTRRQAAASVPVQPMPASTGQGGGWSVPAQVAAPLEPGINFSRITQALVQGDMDRQRAANWAEQTWGTSAGQIVANLEQSTDTKGGFLVDESYSQDFIGLLRPRVAIRALGARVVPMPNGTLTTRKKSAGTAAGYIGERSNIPTTGLEVGEMVLSAKTLAALVPISNKLLRHSSMAVDVMVRDDLQESVAITEDQQWLRGAGSALSPTGLLNQAAAANKFAANATVNLQNVDTDLSALRLRLTNANIPMTAPGYIISPRTEEFLTSLRDGNGNKAYPEIAEGRIGKYPFQSTTSVPINLGVGGDESEIYFADFAQVLIGDTHRLTIASSDVASYHDGTETRSAFQTDETLIRVIEEHDLGLRYTSAVAVLQAVTWGA